MIENELDRIDVLYGLGTRCLGIAYSEGNALGAGLKEPRDGGLTVFGRKAVERMNKLGMTFEGLLREAACKWGRYEDVAVYGLLDREWHQGTANG